MAVCMCAYVRLCVCVYFFVVVSTSRKSTCVSMMFVCRCRRRKQPLSSHNWQYTPNSYKFKRFSWIHALQLNRTPLSLSKYLYFRFVFISPVFVLSLFFRSSFIELASILSTTINSTQSNCSHIQQNQCYSISIKRFYLLYSLNKLLPWIFVNSLFHFD